MLQWLRTAVARKSKRKSTRTKPVGAQMVGTNTSGCNGISTLHTAESIVASVRVAASSRSVGPSVGISIARAAT